MIPMEYVAYKRARFNATCGPVNIPFGSILRVEGDFLYWNDLPVCAVTSQNAYDFFARNDDGQGLERGALVNAIRLRLQKRDGEYQRRWNKVWGDSVSRRYRRKDQEDYWLWSFDFYNAPVEDLRHIAALIRAKWKGR